MKKILAVASLALLSAAGCSAADKPAASSSPSPSVSVEVRTVAKRYLTVSELAVDVQNSSSLKCDMTYEEIQNPIGALERASCTESTGFGIYADKDDAKASAESIGELVTGVAGDKSVFVIGQNWSVNCGQDEALAREIAGKLGGEVFITQPQ